MAPPGPPVRMIARVVTELLFARRRNWDPLIAQGRQSSIIVESMMSASLAHLPLRDGDGEWYGIDQVLLMGRPVSALAIARAMQLPYSTVARQADELVAAGWLVRGRKGLQPAPDRFTAKALRKVAAADRAALCGSVAALAGHGYAPAIDALDAGLDRVPPGVVERALMAFALRMFETLNELYGDATNGVLSAITVAANVRHITENPELSERFALETKPPPDTMRRPVTLRGLAQLVDMPFETVRRRMDAMIAAGMAERVEGGVIVPTRFLMSPAQRRNNRRTKANFDLMLQQLGAAASP